MPVTSTLERWNAISAEAAEAEVLPCCGSRAWARGMAARRPIATAEEMEQIAGEIWRGLDRAAWTEAFRSHPRIGERKPDPEGTTAASLAWSGEEQSRAMEAEAAVRQRLAEANGKYERRFGRIFLICAQGMAASQVLDAIERRLGEDELSEWNEAGEQQRRITALRLKRWIGGS